MCWYLQIVGCMLLSLVYSGSSAPVPQVDYGLFDECPVVDCPIFYYDIIPCAYEDLSPTYFELNGATCLGCPECPEVDTDDVTTVGDDVTTFGDDVTTVSDDVTTESVQDDVITHVIHEDLVVSDSVETTEESDSDSGSTGGISGIAGSLRQLAGTLQGAISRLKDMLGGSSSFTG